MVYIKGLKFRGFKSFRKAEASFINGYVCLAGPNGSGKSNVTDGIRFALGEASLKSLRAKKVAELVNTSCKYAEVTLFIDGERQFEIKRAINAEGKTLYRINGKRSTRTLVMEELRPYGLEAGSHNIIAQGQVQKIVEMNAKERRQIIDSVAGISEFDQKKNEALSELSTVEQKITEAKIVLGEREALLTELEKEKNDALSYTDAQTSFRRAKASIANAEHAKLNKSFTDVVQKHTALKAAIGEISKQSGVLQSRIAELDSKKQEIVAKLGSQASREAALREIEELKGAIGVDSATLSERRKEVERLESQQKQLASQIESLKKSQKEAASLASALSSQVKSLFSQIASMEGNGSGENKSEKELAGKLELLSEKVMSLKERSAANKASQEEGEKMLAMRKEEASRLSSIIGAKGGEAKEGESDLLKKEVLALQAKLDSLFDRERQLNRSLPELDKRMLSLKEKAALLRASLSPSASSLAVKAVEQMKEEGMKGIYGTVSSLVGVEPKYGNAVEAAAGQRLNYMVVDRMDTAIRAIEKLKQQRVGRCTFIPLDIPRQNYGKPARGAGCIGALIEFVDFDAAFQPAMEYVFSDTLLYDNVQNAKKAGIGLARMVSLDGELIEKSGIISGGSQKGSLLSKSALDKAEAEAEEVKRQREALYAQLYSIRDEMSALRKEKADAEVKLRGFEIEAESQEKMKESLKRQREALSEAGAQANELEKKISALRAEGKSLAKELESVAAQHASAKKALAEAQEKAKQADSESSRRLQKLHAEKSSLEAQMEAKKGELSRLVSEQSEKEKESSGAGSLFKDCRRDIESLMARITQNRKVQEEKENKFAEMSAGAKKLYAQLQEHEAQIGEISGQLGKVKAEEDRKNRELMDLEVKRQTTEQRLSDLKAELDQYSGVPTIDASRTELEELSRASQSKMESLGQVNLRAPELYEQKKRDIDDIKMRVGSLDSEKNAVLGMMGEIEAKKREIFLSTFTAVNENFRKLFGYAFKGEGTMLLETPSSPFEGGLHVKVREGSHDKYLESMSGGEKSLLALIFIFSIQMHKAAPFYILDEADAALDKENSRKLADLIRQLASKTQFIVVTHNDTVLSNAQVALGVTRTEDGSKIVGVQLTSVASVAKQRKA